MGLHPAQTLDNKPNTTDMDVHPAQTLDTVSVKTIYTFNGKKIVFCLT